MKLGAARTGLTAAVLLVGATAAACQRSEDGRTEAALASGSLDARPEEQVDPEDARRLAESERRLGELAAGRRSPGEAAEHFGRCASLDSDDAECRYGLGLALAELGELDRAAVELRGAAEILDRAEAWAELGKLERRRRRLDAATSAFSRGLARDRHHLPSLLGLGQMLMATGRVEIGQELLERHREQAAFEDHLEAFRRAAADPEADVEVLLELARMYHLREDLEREEATLRKALARAPDSLPAILALVNHLLYRGRVAEAERQIGRLDAASAGHPAALFLRARVALARGDREEAGAQFAASLAAGDWPPLVYVDAGKAWAEAGAPAQAAEAFRRAIQGAPGAVEAYTGLAESERSQGRLDQALGSVHRALELDRSDGTALLLRAVLEVELGEPRRARAAFADALAGRRLDLVVAGGADDLRRELEALAPPAEAVRLFDQELERHRAEGSDQL